MKVFAALVLGGLFIAWVSDTSNNAPATTTIQNPVGGVTVTTQPTPKGQGVTVVASVPERTDSVAQATSSAIAAESNEPKPLPGVVLRAYDLVKNPFRYKHSIVVLDVAAFPILYNGSVLQYSAATSNPQTAAALGLFGVRFNKMIAEDKATYDVIGTDAQIGSNSEMLGQIVVVTSEGELQVNRAWEIEPLGTVDGTNGLGAFMSWPLIRFVKYADPAQ